MAFRFDRSSCTVLTICDRCEWFELVLDDATARQRALEHAWSVHPSDRATLDVLHRWTSRRRAAASG